MARIKRYRPAPATVIASIALFVALGGVGYAAATLPKNSVGSAQVKNNSIRSGDIRNGNVRNVDLGRNAVQGDAVADNSLGGDKVIESTFGKVPLARRSDEALRSFSADSSLHAENADTLDGKDANDFVPASGFPRFVEFLEAGQERQLATSGPLTLDARCTSSGGTDSIEVRVTSSVAGAREEDNGILTAGTPSVVLSNSSSTGTPAYDNDIDDGSTIAPDGSYIGYDGEIFGLGLNLAGHRCVVAGAVVTAKGTP